MPLPRRMITLAALLTTLLTAGLASTAGPAVAAAPVPSSMASIGDSITRGFNACGFYLDCTARSFGTGDSAAVDSHYLRIRAVNPAIAGRNHNVGETGADSADLAGQVTAAANLGVDYVTILIGANDACADSEASMTPVATFRGRVDAALATLKTRVPSARVLIISIPDLKRLWSVGRVNPLARTAWSLLGICQSMLANPTSTAAADAARRDRVRQRVVDYNAQLAQACAGYGANCRFDGNVVFNYPFTLSQVSSWDYFHPNTTGQAVLAEVSYEAGFTW
ncbi:GDSL-type esterase/lipase family protein [Actinomycetes bacterium KLBMP 9797]